MADPVSSVSYAIQAALKALNGNLSLLLPTMALVIAVIVVVVINYSQLVARFPEGGGAAAATGQAFSEAWAFVPMGALIVDFGLTIAVSVAAGASAIVAYLPTLAPIRIILALALLLFVASLSWYGHSARSFFGVLTIVFIAVSGLDTSHRRQHRWLFCGEHRVYRIKWGACLAGSATSLSGSDGSCNGESVSGDLVRTAVTKVCKRTLCRGVRAYLRHT